jgi:hypothetical protein
MANPLLRTTLALALGVLTLFFATRYAARSGPEPAPEVSPEIAAPDPVAEAEPADDEPIGLSIGIPEGYRVAREHSRYSSGVSALWFSDGADYGTGKLFAVRRERVDGGYCHLGYCDAPAVGELVAGGVTWDFLGEMQYCDAGECGQPARYYRAEVGGYRYYASFVREPREEEILSGLRLDE